MWYEKVNWHSIIQVMNRKASFWKVGSPLITNEILKSSNQKSGTGQEIFKSSLKRQKSQN